MPNHQVLHRALDRLLSELLNGPSADASFVLNPGDAGLLRSLDMLSANAASDIPPGGGSSVAAHVDHLRYGLGLLNRWSRGEQPFADADYSASWERTTVTDDEWSRRRDELRREALTWQQVVRTPRDMDEIELSGVIGSLVHLAYHIGAIRQIDRTIRGPKATD
jgi:hypothetical protein